MELNPNCFWDNGNFTGLLTKKLRTPRADGKDALRALLTDLQTALTAASASTEATAVGTVLTYLNTAANLNAVVAPF